MSFLISGKFVVGAVLGVVGMGIFCKTTHELLMGPTPSLEQSSRCFARFDSDTLECIFLILPLFLAAHSLSPKVARFARVGAANRCSYFFSLCCVNLLVVLLHPLKMEALCPWQLFDVKAMIACVSHEYHCYSFRDILSLTLMIAASWNHLALLWIHRHLNTWPFEVLDSIPKFLLCCMALRSPLQLFIQSAMLCHVLQTLVAICILIRCFFLPRIVKLAVDIGLAIARFLRVCELFFFGTLGFIVYQMEIFSVIEQSFVLLVYALLVITCLVFLKKFIPKMIAF